MKYPYCLLGLMKTVVPIIKANIYPAAITVRVVASIIFFSQYNSNSIEREFIWGYSLATL